MKKYLAALKKQPNRHQKHFALLVSGTFTLIIFAIWSLVMFRGPSEVRLAEKQIEKEPGPLSSLISNTASTFQAIKGDLSALKELLNIHDR